MDPCSTRSLPRHEAPGRLRLVATPARAASAVSPTDGEQAARELSSLVDGAWPSHAATGPGRGRGADLLLACLAAAAVACWAAAGRGRAAPAAAAGGPSGPVGLFAAGNGLDLEGPAAWASSWSPRAPRAADAGERALVARQCSDVNEDCLSTRCCSDPSAHCLEKNRYWAVCRHECPDSHLGGPWTCRRLDLDLQQANKTSGSAGSCSRPGEDCRVSRCCHNSGQRCYKKDGAWASCRDACEKGKHDPYGPDKRPWSCEDLGPRDEASADRVLSTGNETRCSDGISNCRETRCCADVGFLCFEKNKWWAQCKESCLKGEKDTSGPDSLPWSCRLLGTRNHGKPNVSNVSVANVLGDSARNHGKPNVSNVSVANVLGDSARAARGRVETPPGSSANVRGDSARAAQKALERYLRCSAFGVDCSETQCCRDKGFQCFEKNLSYSGCLPECHSNLMPAWTCALRSSNATKLVV